MIRRNSLLRALIICLPLVVVTARAEEQIQAPVFQEGDFWKFKIIQKAAPGYPHSEWNGVYLVRYANGRIQIRKLVDEKEVPPEPNVIPALLGFSKTEGEHALEFPLSVGKEFQYSYKSKSFVKTKDVVNIQVMSKEPVTTEAGVFQAFKIESTRQWGGTRRVIVPATYFYSPEAKTIVKYDSENDDGYVLHVELLESNASH